MDDQKVDRRVRKTKKLLLQGLTKLMSEKPLNKITVKELTELADVNRATFYLYYNDIFDMLEKVETEMFKYLNEAVRKLTCATPGSESSKVFLNYVFIYIKEHSDLCKILLGPHGDYAFLEKLKKSINEHFPIHELKMDKTHSSFSMPFIISGCIGAIQKWLEDDMNATTEEMTDFIIDMGERCILGKKR